MGLQHEVPRYLVPPLQPPVFVILQGIITVDRLNCFTLTLPSARIKSHILPANQPAGNDMSHHLDKEKYIQKRNNGQA